MTKGQRLNHQVAFAQILYKISKRAKTNHIFSMGQPSWVIWSSQKVQWAAFCFWWIRWSALMSNLNSMRMRDTILMHWANVSPNCMDAFSFSRWGLLGLILWATPSKIYSKFIQNCILHAPKIWLSLMPWPLRLLTSLRHLKSRLPCMFWGPIRQKSIRICFKFYPKVIQNVVLSIPAKHFLKQFDGKWGACKPKKSEDQLGR